MALETKLNKIFIKQCVRTWEWQLIESTRHYKKQKLQCDIQEPYHALKLYVQWVFEFVGYLPGFIYQDDQFNHCNVYICTQIESNSNVT